MDRRRLRARARQPADALQIGQCLGIAVTGSILAGNLAGRPLQSGFVAAGHAGWLLLAAMGGVVFVLALVTTSQWALGTAARTAATFDTGDPGTAEPRAAGPLRPLRNNGTVSGATWSSCRSQV